MFNSKVNFDNECVLKLLPIVLSLCWSELIIPLLLFVADIKFSTNVSYCTISAVSTSVSHIVHETRSGHWCHGASLTRETHLLVGVAA